MTFQEKLFRTGLLLTAIAIALNAFGHHSLKPVLTAAQLSMFETASTYLLWGSAWMLILALGFAQFNLPKVSVYSILLGLFLFSGSLLAYLIYPLPLLMALTPFGGLLMMSGFIVCATKKTKSK
jgi:uncharacterized membrane protein YgdD (TMEM256/DUF423 family)